MKILIYQLPINYKIYIFTLYIYILLNALTWSLQFLQNQVLSSANSSGYSEYFKHSYNVTFYGYII